MIPKNEQNSPNSDLTRTTYPVIREILHIIKEAFNGNISANNYDICMKDVKNIITNNCLNSNEFEERSEELIFCEKAIGEDKLKELNIPEQDKIKLLSDMTIITFRYAYDAVGLSNKKLLNIFISFLKGWIKSNNLNIRQVITNELLGNINYSWFADLAFHAYLINLKLLDLNEYQNLLLSYLENQTTRAISIKLITYLKKFKINDSSNPSSIKLPKIFDFYYNEKKCNKYFTFFGTYCKVPSDLNFSSENFLNYKICNMKNQNIFDTFKILCHLSFEKIYNIKFPYLNLESSELFRILSNFIQSPFINNHEQLCVYIMVITELCTKKINIGNDLDNFPDTEARCIFTLLMALPENLNKMKIFEIILNGIFKAFHYDYIKSTFKFNQRPYFKLLYNLIYFFNALPNDSKIIISNKEKKQYMLLFAQYLKFFSPQYYPGFAFAWLELISSEFFISYFLGEYNNTQTNEKRENNNYYLSLILEIFIFLKKCYNKQVNKTFMDYVYKYLYFLCKIYPEFIIENNYIILLSFPYENIYIQIKNLILSTIPKKLEQIKYLNFEDKDLENEINNNTLVDYNLVNLFDIINILKKFNIFNYIEKYIENNNFEMLKNICNILNQNNNMNFNFCVIQSLVIYYGQNVFSKNNSISDGHIFFLDMIKLIEDKNRILLINSLLNLLTFPSKQTIFFVLVILNILTNLNNEKIEENIVTLLLERLSVKPIPWGIELLFKKLLQGYKYDLMKTVYFKNFNNGEIFINNLKEFLEDKKFIKFKNFENNKIDIILAEEKKETKMIL